LLSERQTRRGSFFLFVLSQTQPKNGCI
jgi:hypothetical protein